MYHEKSHDSKTILKIKNTVGQIKYIVFFQIIKNSKVLNIEQVPHGVVVIIIGDHN